MMPGRTLYEKLGGFSNISKIVMSFYDTLLDNDEVGPFFDDIDMSRMVDHQTKFVASLLGGPASYTDTQLRHLHSHLEITNAHFDELETVLRD
ncbi:MAG: group 1 truncated hemoglobin, partial [Pseudomonadota bacterium]